MDTDVDIRKGISFCAHGVESSVENVLVVSRKNFEKEGVLKTDFPKILDGDLPTDLRRNQQGVLWITGIDLRILQKYKIHCHRFTD